MSYTWRKIELTNTPNKCDASFETTSSCVLIVNFVPPLSFAHYNAAKQTSAWTIIDEAVAKGTASMAG